MAGREGAEIDIDVWYDDMSWEYCGGGSSCVDGELLPLINELIDGENSAFEGANALGDMLEW